MTIRELLVGTKEILLQGGISNAAWEAAQLTGACCSVEPGRLPLVYPQAVPPEAASRCLSLAARRAEHYPLQYLLGEWEFYGRRFLVGEGVLIPRQDTELLCEVGLSYVKNHPGAAVLDLCSGSGCVGITLKKEREDLQVTAVEYSPQAFGYLERNAALNQAGLRLVRGDALSPREDLSGFDLILCNPPYLTQDDMEQLQPEVRFEPASALYGEKDGLMFYRELSKVWIERLNPGGTLCYEIGRGQEKAVEACLRAGGMGNICFHRDLCGIIRVVCGTKPGC